jgi:hypothetical protein
LKIVSRISRHPEGMQEGSPWLTSRIPSGCLKMISDSTFAVISVPLEEND